MPASGIDLKTRQSLTRLRPLDGSLLGVQASHYQNRDDEGDKAHQPPLVLDQEHVDIRKTHVRIALYAAGNALPPEPIETLIPPLRKFLLRHVGIARIAKHVLIPGTHLARSLGNPHRSND